MGGKPKQAARTKNNMRPSSSGRSAELLGQAVSGFVGFTTVENSGVVPIVPGFGSTSEILSDELDLNNIDDNFKIVLKKLSKKDPVTKQKGLQEFAELIQKSDIEIIKPILRLWPRLYSQLSTDSDLRVREFVQTAHASLVNKAGKFVAPYVKQITAPWIASKFDSHPIAGSIAATAFQKSFTTEEKQKNLILFCESEILEFVTKNLTVHTASTLLNPKNHTPEELEAKYQRVVIGSLRAYAFYLKKVPVEEQKYGEKNVELIENAKFWSFHKSKDSGIRSAWFEVISSCLRHCPNYLASRHEALTVIAFLNMDDTDSMVAPHIWACIVLIQVCIENWYDYVNRDKVFLPKLCKVLKSGGSGNAVVVYPHLLPLISKLNEKFVGDMNEFYKTFFDVIKEGLQVVSTIKSELTAVIIGYYETLKYVMIQLASASDESSYAIAENLLDTHIIGIIYWAMNCDGSYIPKQIFTHISALIAYWKQQNNDFCMKLLARFWSETLSVLKSTVDSQLKLEKITNAHFELVMALKHCANGTIQGRHKHGGQVKFTSDTDEVDAVVNDNKQIMSSFEADLNQLIRKLCAIYLANAQSCKNVIFVHTLERIAREFPTKNTFESFLEEKSLMKVFGVFEGWLVNEPNLRTESVVELAIMLMQHVTEQEKQIILERLAKIQVEEVQKWVLLRLLSHPLSQEPCVAAILSLPEITSFLVKCSKKVVANEALDNLNLLHKCFFQNEAGDILINVETTEAIVDTVNEIFDLTDKTSLDSCASFIAQIMPVICSDKAKCNLQHRTFLKLFGFSVKSVVSDDLSEDTLWEVTTAWQDSLSSGDIKLTEELLQSCSEIVKNQIVQENESEGLERLTELCSKLINCSTEDLQEDEEKLKNTTIIFKALTYPFQSDFISDLNKFIELSQYLEAMNGAIFNPDLEYAALKNLQFENIPELLSSMTKFAIFKAGLLFKMTCSVKNQKNIEDQTNQKNNDTQENDDEELTEDYVNTDEGLLKVWSDGLYEEAIDVIHAATVADILINYEFSQYHEDNLIYLSEKVSSLLSNVPEKLQIGVKSLVFEKVQMQPSFECRTLPLLQNLSSQFSDPENASIIILEDISENFKRDQPLDLYASILQALTPNLQRGGLPITPNLFENHQDLHAKVVAERMLIKNHFGDKLNEFEDKKIIGNALIILHEILMKQKNEAFLLYNTDIAQVKDSKKVIVVVQVIYLIQHILKYFPTELDGTRWDFIRLALSSWVLSVSKSSGNIAKDEKVNIFIIAVFELFRELMEFFKNERQKSSTELLSKVIEEWDQVFAKENNLVLIKSFMQFVNISHSTNFLLKNDFFQKLIESLALVDIKSIVDVGKLDNKTTIDDFVLFLIENIDDHCHTLRICCATILRNLSTELIKTDLAALDQTSVQTDDNDASKTWHILNKFYNKLECLTPGVSKFIEEFNFKYEEDDSHDFCAETMPYLLIWNTILFFIGKAPAELRSVYTQWISRNNFEDTLLPFLFKLLPKEILKNPDSCSAIGKQTFAPLDWRSIANDRLSHQRYGAYIYTECLRFIPAIVRKWWNGTNQRHSSIIDKITTNFVSPLLCQDEFQALIQRKDKTSNNMNIKVAATSRQVTAVYSIDEAKLELIITLPVNYPLGAVKVESGKAIGGRLQSRQIVMQCTIFLTHQNGSIFDGLSLWKRNLDRKFEGVEECYICYAVIHQETCQLPKLTCKTCKKKFHGPCLYKWFHTSNKSTCPICRNIF